MQIFNVKAIAKLIEESKEFTNLYHRLYYLFNGASNTVTLEIIDEVERIVDDETKKLKKYLKEMRAKIPVEK